MVSIGERLREERVRLECSQTAFGKLGGVTKKTQMLYEASERFPDAQYLAAVAEAGVDVLYVLTGQHVLHGQTAKSVVTSPSPGTVVSMPLSDQVGLTQQEVMTLVLDALYEAKRTLPASRIYAVVDAVMAWQRAGMNVTESSVVEQLRQVK